jgi:hypothetical protein
MPKKRAHITREVADDLYEDVIDRVTAAVDEEAAERPRRARPAEPPLMKVTVYLAPADILAIDRIVSEDFRRTGKRPRRSSVVSTAIQAYLAQREAAEGSAPDDA